MKNMCNRSFIIIRINLVDDSPNKLHSLTLRFGRILIYYEAIRAYNTCIVVKRITKMSKLNNYIKNCLSLTTVFNDNI